MGRMEDGTSGMAEARVICSKRRGLACVLALRLRARAPARDEFLDAFGIDRSAAIGRSPQAFLLSARCQRFSSTEFDVMLTCD